MGHPAGIQACDHHHAGFVQTPSPAAVGQCSQGLMFLSGSAMVSSGCCTLSLLPGQPVPLTQTTALFWELFWTPATDLNTPQPLGSAHGCRGCCHILPPAPTARTSCCQGPHRAHLPTRDSTSDDRRSHCSVPSTHLGSNPWCFPASPLQVLNNDEEKS